MKINIEEIIDIKARLREINSTPLEELEFYKDGEKIKISKEEVERFKFTGLCNVDFVMMDIMDLLKQ